MNLKKIFSVSRIKKMEKKENLEHIINNLNYKCHKIL